MEAWNAPSSDTPVVGVVEVPGSKSITNRALVLGALSNGPSVVRRPLFARDTDLMAAALHSLGCAVERDGDDLLLEPGPLRGPARVDCGLAGTVMRFVPAVAALASGEVFFDGDERARQRPMGAIIGALRELGVEIDDAGTGTLPFTVSGTGRVRGGEVRVDASASSQFVSALLLAGARYEQGVTVVHVGDEAVPSQPHIEMTVQMLRERGVDVSSEPNRWRVEPGEVAAVDVTVEPDLSNAAPFLAAALVTGGRVTVAGWPRRTTQAGAALADLFAAMGAGIELDERGLTLTGPERPNGIDVDLHEVGELAPVLAACCALAATPSRLRGIGHLRGHESDRLAALEAELTALGCGATATADALLIEPRPLHPATFHSYEDHRMATAGAVLGLRVPGLVVDDISTTSKTLPDFAAAWQRLVAPARGSGSGQVRTATA